MRLLFKVAIKETAFNYQRGLIGKETEGTHKGINFYLIIKDIRFTSLTNRRLARIEYSNAVSVSVSMGGMVHCWIS